MTQTIPPGERLDTVTYAVKDRAGLFRISGATEERASALVEKLAANSPEDGPYTMWRVTYVSFTHRELIKTVKAP